MKDKTKKEVLEEWIRFKGSNVTTEDKLNEYRRMIGLFFDLTKKPLSQYGESDMVKFINIANKKYNIRSMNEVKTLLRNFVIWYYPDYSQRFRSMNVLLRHLRIEPTYSSKDMLNKEEVEKIIKAEESIKWKTFWLTQFYGGMRPSETAQLKWQDVTFSNEGAFVEVYVKKNQKKFTKFLPEQVSFYLKKLKESSTSDYVFPSREKDNGKELPMKRYTVYNRLKVLSQKVLNKKVNPYLLRHSIATILYNEEGADKDFVAEQMGHSRNMEKTYSHLDEEKIKEKLRKLYIKTEDLPPEKKAEYEQRIAKLEKANKDMVSFFKYFAKKSGLKKIELDYDGEKSEFSFE